MRGSVLSCESAGDELRLLLSANLAAIEDGRRCILKHFEPLALGATAVNHFEVIFEELVANSVRHGLAEKPAGLIYIVAQSGTGTIDLVIEDDGIAFNPLDTPEPSRFESLETAKIGGLGISLVRKLSASFQYMAPHAVSRAIGDRLFEPTNRVAFSVSTR